MVYTGCAWSTRWATSPELICSLTKRAHCAALRGGVVVDSPTSVRKKHVEQQKKLYIYIWLYLLVDYLWYRCSG